MADHPYIFVIGSPSESFLSKRDTPSLIISRKRKKNINIFSIMWFLSKTDSLTQIIFEFVFTGFIYLFIYLTIQLNLCKSTIVNF